MKNANTTQFTVGQEVLYTGSYGVSVIEEIKGKTAKIKTLHAGEILTKRLNSLKLYSEPNLTWGEQEAAHLTYAKHNHGDTVYSVLSGDGDGGVFVWDAVKNTVVRKNELTVI